MPNTQVFTNIPNTTKTHVMSANATPTAQVRVVSTGHPSTGHPLEFVHDFTYQEGKTWEAPVHSPDFVKLILK